MFHKLGRSYEVRIVEESHVVKANGIGELFIGMSAAELTQILRFRVPGGENEPPKYSLINPYPSFYEDASNTIFVFFDIKVGLVTSISGRNGFGGSTPDGLRVGMPVKSIVEEKSGWVLDDFGGVLVNPSYPGLCLELDNSDPDPEDLPSLIIEGISVFDAALDLELLIAGEDRVELDRIWSKYRYREDGEVTEWPAGS